MRRASLIEKETREITTVEDLTGVFESLASTQIAKIKDKVTLAEEFFELLWRRYTSIRIDPHSRLTNRSREDKNNRKVFVMISGEAGLSGDIDQRLIEAMLKEYDPNSTDIVILGTHGATQLKDRNISYIRFFKVPETDSYIDASPILDAISPYSTIKLFYEVYVSLGVQEIKTIDLITEVQTMGKDVDYDENIISDKDTIFEPSLEEIAGLMEKGMMNLALGQAILESSLAQSASRFNAMASAKKKAFELVAMHRLEYHRAKRSEGDRRLREILTGIKKKKQRRARKQA